MAEIFPWHLISMARSSEGLYLPLYLTSWPTSPDQAGIKRGLFPYLRNHRNQMENIIMEDLVKWIGINTFQITCGKNCYFQVQVWEFWLTLEKLFGQTFLWEASFYASMGWKKAGGGGHGVLISEVFFLLKWISETKHSILCHSTAWAGCGRMLS